MRFLFCLLLVTGLRVSIALLVAGPQSFSTPTLSVKMRTGLQMSVGDAIVDPSRMERQASIHGVTLKMAFDQQMGVADLAEEKSERFTCSESLDMVHRLRRDSDAVLVGRQTVAFDDCTLTVRRVEPRHSQDQTPQQPVRVVVDPNRKLLEHYKDYKIITDGLDTIIYYRKDETTPNAVECLADYPKVRWIGLPPDDGKSNRLSAKAMQQNLATEHNIHHIMVEGGPATARSFLDEKLVDRAILVHADMLFQNPAPSNLSSKDFENAGLELIRTAPLGDDRVEYWCRPGLEWPDSQDDNIEFWP